MRMRGRTTEPMKGRRRARRTALQALYELDLTTHPVDAVLRQRIEAMYATSLTGRVGPALAERAAALAAARTPDEAAGLSTADMGAELGCGEAEAGAIVLGINAIASQAQYAAALVRGVWALRERLDEVIATIAPEWPVEQMAPLDRNIMRMAIWEVATEASPERVAISEAVELARQFSGEGSRRMVNGALGTFAADRAAFAGLDLAAPAAGSA